MIRDSKIQTESLVAGAESPLVSTYSFSKPLSSKFRVVVFLIHEGQGRTPLLIHEGPLRGTKNGNGNTFVRGGHGGPRRTATAELQLQLLFVHEGPRRTAKYTSIYPRRILRATKNGNGNTFVRGGRGGPRRTATAELQLQLLFVHEGPRRTATATPLSAEVAEGRGERHLWSPQIVVVGNENLAGNGPILPAGA